MELVLNSLFRTKVRTEIADHHQDFFIRELHNSHKIDLLLIATQKSSCTKRWWRRGTKYQKQQMSSLFVSPKFQCAKYLSKSGHRMYKICVPPTKPSEIDSKPLLKEKSSLQNIRCQADLHQLHMFTPLAHMGSLVFSRVWWFEAGGWWRVGGLGLGIHTLCIFLVFPLHLECIRKGINGCRGGSYTSVFS